jgi:hypothetical protein
MIDRRRLRWEFADGAYTLSVGDGPAWRAA